MAITTLDGIIAGVQPAQQIAKSLTTTLVVGQPRSLWYRSGLPPQATLPADTTTATGIARSSTSALVAGQIPHVDPGTNAYLYRFLALSSTSGGTLLLCDRLWDCGAQSNGSAISMTATTSQTINSTAWPARDIAGSTNGDGVLAAVEVSSLLGGGSGTFTITYTNQAGTGSHTATNINARTGTEVADTFYPFGLQAGDTGIRSIQSFQASVSSVSGQFCLVAYRVLCALPLWGIGQPNELDVLTAGFPRLYNGVVPFLVFIPTTAAATNVNAVYQETQG